MESIEETLDKLGFRHRYDTFFTYWKEIDDYEIIFSKHISNTDWVCTLVSHDTDHSDEITINYNCTTEWALNIVKLLEEAPNE